MNTDTPETDATDTNQKAKTWESSYWNMREHARKLERERDEIRAQLREEQQLHVQTLNERDALRFAVRALKLAKGRFHTEQAATKLFDLLP